MPGTFPCDESLVIAFTDQRIYNNQSFYQSKIALDYLNYCDQLIIMNLLSLYNNLLIKSPLLTKSVTGGFMFSLGDLIVQKMEREFDKKENRAPKPYDFRRLGIAWLMGNVFMMPLFHYQFTYVLPWAVRKLPFDTSTPFRWALGSVLIDQSVWACYILCHYLMFINLLEHGSPSKGLEAIENNFVKAMITNWKIWPAAQIINFWFIPKQFQVLWVNIVGLFWNVYLSYIQHN